MRNQIFYVAKEEIELLKKRLATASDTYVMELDGKSIQTEAEYVREMDIQLKVPYGFPPDMVLSWYYDDITRCIWIEESHIVLIIRSFESMLKDYPKVKSNIIDDFNEITLPWWGGDIVGHLVGGSPKEFLVYLEVEK